MPMNLAFDRNLWQAVATMCFMMQMMLNYLTINVMCMYVQGDCWICMELMSISLDKFYKFVHDHLSDSIPEDILGKITVAVTGPVLCLEFP